MSVLHSVGGGDVWPIAPHVQPRKIHHTEANVAGQLVYAVGDIHGCYDLLRDLLAQIAADAATHAHGRRPVLIFLGDYADRGPDTAKVLDTLVWLRRRDRFDLHLLKGNHDLMVLNFIDAPEKMADWLRIDGGPTLASYGVQPPAVFDEEALTLARDELLEAMPASHLELLRRLKLMVTVGDYAFVHAGVRPKAALETQSEEDLLWIRDDFLGHPGPHPKVVVHGHSWDDDQPRLHPHRLGLDTGAYETGALTAARIQDRKVVVLQARAGG